MKTTHTGENKEYRPSPVSKENIKVPDHLQALVKRIAQHEQMGMVSMAADLVTSGQTEVPRVDTFLTEEETALWQRTATLFVQEILAAGGVISFHPDFEKISDPDSIEIPAELKDLREAIAFRRHEEWCEWQMSRGYRHGPIFDGDNLKDPGLTWWSKTPESHRQECYEYADFYIRKILSMGATIQAPDLDSILEEN